MPYFAHLSYQITFKQVQKSLYSPEITLNITDYVLGHEDCQQDKSSHRLLVGSLEFLKLPKQKREDISGLT